MRKELFAKKIVDQAEAKLQKQGLDKIDLKQLMVIIASHFNNELESISNEMRGIKKVGWGIVISIIIGVFGGILVNYLTKFLP